jgi:Fic family protein
MEDPLLCPTEEKAEREAANTHQQLMYIERLLDLGPSFEFRESHICDFHRLAIEGLFPCGGQYRNVTRTAELEGGKVTHVPPEPALIPGLVREMVDFLNQERADLERRRRARRRWDGITRLAAYALWRLNWIHPFAGGNGRTARAVTHLLLCVDFGGMIPGTPSMPTIIARRRREYESALRSADAAEKHGRENLVPMTRLVTNALVEQLLPVVIQGRRDAAHSKRAANERRAAKQRAFHRKNRKRRR